MIVKLNCAVASVTSLCSESLRGLDWVCCADCANGKKGAPPKAEKLVDSHKEEIKKAVSRHPGHPLVLVGKSMGARYLNIFVVCYDVL
jgi:predicted alpha/beta-hydrolase family hydrolase